MSINPIHQSSITFGHSPVTNKRKNDSEIRLDSAEGDQFISSKRQKTDHQPKKIPHTAKSEPKASLYDSDIDSDDEDSDVEGGYRQTDLHVAAALGDVPQIHKLMRGAYKDYLNEADEDGNTALHLAAMEGKVPAVRVLLGKQGIDTLIPNNNEETALDLAKAQGHESIARLLQEREGSRSPLPMKTGGLDFYKDMPAG